MTDTQLNSPPMGDESTQAADPVTSGTAPAPSEDATQSIYAWSQDDADTEVVRRRSWKLPVAIASLAAVAAITAGVIAFWPHHDAEKTPLPAQTHAQPANPDAQYLNALRSVGATPLLDRGNDTAVGLGHVTCDALAQGITKQEAADSIARHMPQLTPAQDQYLVDQAAAAYCPWYR